MVSIIEEARKHIKQQTTWMSVNDVVKWDINPRVITREGLERLKQKIMKYPSFFLARPILVNCGKDGRKVVFCGNQRLEASRELGLQEVPTKERILSPCWTVLCLFFTKEFADSKNATKAEVNEIVKDYKK